jgi:hypothetical protein
MSKTCLLAVLCALAMATPASARTSRAKVVTIADVRQAASPVAGCWNGFICRQDLFDRNNRNNLRSDWPSPPAQPGQF